MLRSTNYTRTASSTEPVTVPDLRRQLKIDDTSEDDELAKLITVARIRCEAKLGDVSLLNATCIDYFNTFADEMELHWSPGSSITSIAYLDGNNASQTLAATVYELGTRNGMGILRRKYDQVWPSVLLHPDVITVTYVAGYGATTSTVPLAIRRWILAYAAWLYANRDGVDFEWQPQMDCLLSPFATGRVYAQ